MRLFASWAFTESEIVEMKPSRSETTRGSALEAYITLYHAGVVTADAMRPYLRHLADGVLKKRRDSRDGWLWYSWTRCCVDMGLEDLYPLAKQAYDEGWVDPMIGTWEHEEKIIQAGREAVLEKSRKEHSGLIGNPLDELGGWHCFTEEARQDDLRRERERALKTPLFPARQLDLFPHPDTIINTTPKPKPNKPCACGSGKKYKKCCGRNGVVR